MDSFDVFLCFFNLFETILVTPLSLLQLDCFEIYALVPGLAREEVINCLRFSNYKLGSQIRFYQHVVSSLVLMSSADVPLQSGMLYMLSDCVRFLILSFGDL